MEEKHQLSVLAEDKAIQISKCSCCESYNVNYRNLFLSFTERELRAFIRMLKSLSPQHFSNFHPEGNKAVISHKRLHYSMAFTQKEVKYLLTKIDQALLMESVYELLSSR